MLKTIDNSRFDIRKIALHALGFAGLAFLSLLLSLKASAQSSVASERYLFPEGSINDGTTIVGPLHRGFSASVPLAFTHDSLSGWSDAAFLTAAYHLKAALSVDATLPYYLHLNTALAGQSIAHDNVFGDVIFAGHFDTDLLGFGCTLTGATTAHNGNQSLALGAGRMTGLVAGHFLRSAGNLLVGDADIAYGNSSELMRQSTRKNYISVGKLGFVQMGGSLLLPRGMSLDAHAYDQLPLGNQVVVSTVLRKNTRSTLFNNESAADDYGLSAKLGVPLTQRLGVAATYDHSVPLSDTLVGVHLTLLLNKPIDRNR